VYASNGVDGICGSGGQSGGAHPGGHGSVGGDGEPSEPAPAKGSGGGMGGNAAAGVPGPGIVSTLTGAAVEYCKGGQGTTTGTGVVAPPEHTGDGGSGGKDGQNAATKGSDGVVVIRYEIA
jgi:hypothetical protein